MSIQIWPLQCPKKLNHHSFRKAAWFCNRKSTAGLLDVMLTGFILFALMDEELRNVQLTVTQWVER